MARRVGFLPRKWLGQSRRSKSEVTLLSDASIRSFSSDGCEQGPARQGDQRRLDRRHSAKSAGDVFISGEQGGVDSSHTPHGRSPHSRQHLRQRHSAWRVCVGDEPRCSRSCGGGRTNDSRSPDRHGRRHARCCDLPRFPRRGLRGRDHLPSMAASLSAAQCSSMRDINSSNFLQRTRSPQN